MKYFSKFLYEKVSKCFSFRHNNGYVTKSQMRQCMAYLCFDCTTEESNIVYEKFRDNTGFNYIKFLEELEPLEKQELKYEKRLKEMKSANKLKVRNLLCFLVNLKLIERRSLVVSVFNRFYYYRRSHPVFFLN